MGIITIDNGYNLFWLGRYSERVMTTLDEFVIHFDRMLDTDPAAYLDFLEKLALPNIYIDSEDFFRRYLSDPDNPDSILSNLDRALEDGIRVREEISTPALGMLQQARTFLVSCSPDDEDFLYRIRSVRDYIYAFMGAADDRMAAPNAVHILKCGRQVERLDLYMRLEQPFEKIEREFGRLCDRLRRFDKNSPYKYVQDSMISLMVIMENGENWKYQKDEALQSLEALFER